MTQRRFRTMRVYNVEFRRKNKDGSISRSQDDITVLARNKKEAEAKTKYIIKTPIKIDNVIRWWDDVEVKDVRGLPRS